MFERIGAYYYFFPTYKQGRKILWEGADREGLRFLAHIPSQLIEKQNDQEMLIEMINGSILRVIGTDDIDSIVGTNPIGCVFSEYSLQNPRAWDFIRPILAENGGWAVFNYTPRGNNHGKQLYELAIKDPDHWFSQKLTVDDTQAIDKTVLQQEKSEMAIRTGNDALYMQEYYCSFDVPIEGAYYGTQMLEAEKEKRITTVPYDPMAKVHTVWDLGVGDSTAIWFYQTIGREIHCIDYLETSGEGLDYYVKALQEKNYIYGNHYAPHDIQVRELSSGKSRLEIAEGLGIKFEIAPNLGVDDGIMATRMLLPRVWFDRNKCERGLNALNSYHKEWDDDNKTWKNKPNHDWSSHGSDAFRYLAVSYQPDDIQSLGKVYSSPTVSPWS